MARSPKDDPRFSDMQHNNTWNYRKESIDNCAHGGLNDRNQHTMSPNPNVMTDNSVYISPNFSGDIYHMNKLPYTGDAVASKDNNVSYNEMANANRVNRQNYGNAMLNLGNGQLVRVFYDENNKQLIFPVSNQYELFKHNQGIIDSPAQAAPSHLFTINQEYSSNANNIHMQPSTATIQNNSFNNQDNGNQANVPTSNFLNEVLGNWEPNSTGTYSPFGQNYPLNHPDAPALNILSNNIPEAIVAPIVKTDASPKRNENSPLAETTSKKRIVAEVKPMRPSYSDVLAKNTKNVHPDLTPIAKPQVSPDVKSVSNKVNSKLDKPINNIKHLNDESKQKNEKKHSTISSGSESGDFIGEDSEKRQKPSKKSKKNMSQKWSSFDDIPNEENSKFNDDRSQFMFIENQSEKFTKKEKKFEKNKSFEKNFEDLDDFKFEENDEPQFIVQDNPADSSKSKKKKDGRNHHKNAKPSQEKKKSAQSKLRKHKPGYLGLAQGYLEHWGGATWKAFIWFIFLLSDICGMSLHLSFDLCTSAFTQTFVSSQAVWRSTKDWIVKIGENKFLLYIDRKFGHTRMGFWRKLKWLKKDAETENNVETAKLSENIPLPATGEEAMKRLLACKGKDPYSILGVSVSCTDEEIKRYYRRQAFLVHPDKNQQPGAEEAFKILQHAFDLIGEPERREAYERRTMESEATWSELSQLLTQLHDKMEFAANTIRCTNCGRRHKRVLTERPCYAARYCAQCKIRHSAKEGDIWAESSMMGLLVMYYACIDGAVYQITQWASCQKKNLRQLRPDCHVVQYRIVLGNKSGADLAPPAPGHEPNLEEFLNNLYNKTGGSPHSPPPKQPTPDAGDAKKRRNKKTKP